MKYIFVLFTFLSVFTIQAQFVSRSGTIGNTANIPALRTFPCAGTTIYEENFNTLQAGEIPTDWQVLDIDTLIPNDNISYLTKGWQRILDFKDSSNIAMASPSWYKAPGSSDDWLITKKIHTGNNSCLSWYAYSQDIYFPEKYDVLISTTGTDTASFTNDTLQILKAVPGEFYSENYRSVSLADYKNKDIYIAFRQRSYDKFVLVLDNVRFAEVVNKDLATFSINTTPHSDTSKSVIIRGSVINEGSDTLKLDSAQLHIHYKAGNGAIQSITINEALKIAPNDTLNWTHDSLWVTPNTYGLVPLCVWFTGVSSQPVNNDTLCIDFGIYPTAISGQIPAKDIQIYPNPTSDILTIAIDKEINSHQLEMRLIDLYGNIVFQQDKLYVGENECSVKEIAAGIYFIYVRDESGKTFTTKLVKY